MKANELRIGNFVRNNMNGEILIAIDILCDGINTGKYEGLNYAFIEPIPLTEEWLLKLGFREIKRRTHEFEEIFYGKSIIKDSPDHLEMLVVAMPFNHCHVGEFLIEDDYLMNIHVNYVHQLQNLYFALTNEELTI